MRTVDADKAVVEGKDGIGRHGAASEVEGSLPTSAQIQEGSTRNRGDAANTHVIETASRHQRRPGRSVPQGAFDAKHTDIPARDDGRPSRFRRNGLKAPTGNLRRGVVVEEFNPASRHRDLTPSSGIDTPDITTRDVQ